MYMTRRIKNTIYQVSVTVTEGDGENMEDRILHIIQNQPVAMGGERGILEAPQPVRRQPERMET
ncbi:MAG: hypothetical protein IJQ45_09245 [Clostridia bacterium]|nr:hypothetical protein [Clostridia bacterium]